MNTTNALNAIKSINSTFSSQPTGTSLIKKNYRLTERHKAGIGKMMEYFDSLHNFGKKFEVHIGFLEDGHTPHSITLNGSAIVKHLGGVLEFEVYGEDGRDILNGIRECYSNDRFQMGFPIGS
jgi:hypothetical protein